VRSFYPLQALKRTARRFDQDRCSTEARALSFLTLLLLVPLLVAASFEFRFFSFLPNLRWRFTEFLSSYFLPETARAMATYLDSVLESSRTIGVMGILFALLLSFFLLLAFSRVVNKIWRRGSRHSLIRTATKFVVLSFVVPVIVVFTAVLNRVFSVERLSIAAGTGFFQRTVVAQFVSLLLNWLLLALLLGLVPNDRVRFSYALLTGIITGTCWFFLRRGLDLYVKFVPQISILYGSLAFVPIFLTWVYLSWLIILFGVELNYTLHEDRGSLQLAR
jgi:membrane protein